MKRAIPIILALVMGLFTAQGQVLVPSQIRVGNITLQVVCEAKPLENVPTPAKLWLANVQQATALFYPGSSRTVGVLYGYRGTNYSYTLTKTSTNVVALPPEPQGNGATDELIPPTNNVGGNRKFSALGAHIQVGDTIIASPTNPVVVDVLICYTPAALTYAGGLSNLLSTAQLAIAEANRAYSNSLTGTLLNLVGLEPIAYTETNSLATDLWKISALSAVQALREQYQADIVTTLVKSRDPNYSGMSYLLGAGDDDAYNVVGIQWAVGYYVLAHEEGHIFGCGHDAANGSGLFSYSHGWVFTANNSSYGTVMAYPGIKYGQFSTPSQTYLGVPIGTTNANNVWTIQQRAPIIASLRGSAQYQLNLSENGTGSITYNGSNAPAALPVPGGIVTLTATGGNFLGWSGSFTSPNSTLSFFANSNYSLTANFADGAQPMAPQFALAPYGTNLLAGQTLTLSAIGLGLPAPSAAWMFNGAACGRGTNLTVAAVTPGNQGNYACVLSNSSGSVTSAVTVTVASHAPVIRNVTNFCGLAITNNFVVLENASNVTAVFSVWDLDPAASNFVLTAICLSNTPTSVAITGTNVINASNAVYTLNFAPGPNQNGSVSVQVIASESGFNASTNTFRFTIKPVNQAPTFAFASSMVTANEEVAGVTNFGFVTNIYVGADNQKGQTWTFAATTAINDPSNAGFVTLPAIATNGTLTFKPKAHSVGTNLVTVVMKTSGSTTNGGVNTETNMFSIAVVPVSHAPTIIAPTNLVTTSENATNASANVTVWDYDLNASNFVFAAAVSNSALASVTVTSTNIVNPSNAVYALNFALGTNQNGTTRVQVIASEAGLASTNGFSLWVKAVNQPPTFTLASTTLTANEEMPGVTNLGFVTNIYVGADNQIGQKWTFATATSTNNPSNVGFATLPAIATNGTLTFKSKPHSYGTNLVTVVMKTTGPTTNGGVNTATNTFSIAVVPISHAPTIIVPTNLVATSENATNASATVTVWDYDSNASNFVIAAAVSNSALASVTVTSTNIVNPSNAVYALNFALGTNQNGTTRVQVVASEAGLASTNSFSLWVKAVNQPPTFTLASSMLIANEEMPGVTNLGFVTNIYVGADNQIGQKWSFATATSTNNPSNVGFATLPAIATNGTLTFKSKPHSYGTNLVTVVMKTTGSNTNGGVNTATNTFSIAVVPISHAPTIITPTILVATSENATNASATVTVWDYDLNASNFVFAAAVSNSALASVTVTSTNIVNPSNAVYTLNFALGTNQNGTTRVQVIASVAGLTSTNSFSLWVKAVNQPPTFTLASTALTANEESPGVTNVGFVTNIFVGADNQKGQTWAFTATTATNDPSNVGFATLPAIATNGTLTFKSKPHSYGTNLVTVVMKTTGSTTNGGANAATNTFSIAVVPISHAPTILMPTNQVATLENATNASTTITVWDYDSNASNFVIAAAVSNSALASITVVSTNIVNPSNVVYTLNFTLGTNLNGTTLVQLVATEAGLNATSSFSLWIKSVNQAPAFTFATNVLVVSENAGPLAYSDFATNLNVGPANQSGQTWSFSVFSATNDVTNVTFAQFPALSTNGTLTFKSSSYAFGTNWVTVVMKSSGSTTNGGVNTATNTFELDVVQVQYPPAITGLTNRTILENATSNLSLAFSVFDPLTTNFNVSATSANTNLVRVSVNGVGTNQMLVFAPVTNMFGTATITVTVDDGLLTNNVLLTNTILWINQAPSFKLAIQSLTVDQYNVAVSLAHAVTNIVAGPTNESGQSVSFIVTNNQPGCFVSPPAVTSSGTLLFTPGHLGGTVTVGIRALDNGGTANGGANTAPSRIFTIIIPPNSFQPLTGPFTGLFYDPNNLSLANAGYFNLLLAADGTFGGYIDCAGSSNAFSGHFSIASPWIQVTSGDYALTLNLDTSASGTQTISGFVSNTAAAWNVPLESHFAGYSAASPTALAGKYTVVMPGVGDPTAGPSGDSEFTVAISAAGVVGLTGYLADDTGIVETNQLSMDGLCPVYVPLYGIGSNGLLIGWLGFTNDASDSLTANSVLTWIKQAGAATPYPSGFTNQVLPFASAYAPSPDAILPFSSGAVILSGGNLPCVLTNSVAISANIFTVDPSATNGLSLYLDTSSGELLGSFRSGGGTNYIGAAILQNAGLASGYFFGTNQGGAFMLIGN